MADVHSVHNLLDRLRQPGKSNEEALKRLFYEQLEYDRVNRTLSRQGWTEQAKSVLAADPVLLATGGDDFQIIYSRLKSDRLLKTEERPVVSRLLQEHPYSLFVFSNQQQDRWHFLNVKYDDDVQRRRLFRRISISPEDHLRTASERISRIGLRDLPDAAPIAIQARHDEAFDVEPVTKEFFQEYRRVFEQVEAAVRGISNDERKRLFAQRLFNRIMFIAFVQKKGWLKFGGDTDYLRALWHDHQREDIRGKNFYADRLKLLFFAGLNGGAAETDVANINRGGQMRNVYGEVPYLNGGLFEEDEDDKNRSIVVPDSAVALIVDERDGLFSRFNFTVTESTPLDVEIAVDPEMLGKIFEELVTGRHETGSYYTPKPIVSFMCREALKGYLSAAVPDQTPDAIEKFVDEHQPQSLRNAEAVLEALRRIKVCDPACGSGAYLLGMLHELFGLRECLFATKKLDSLGAHQRKLEIIQNNVYGVDIDEFAVNIARLRLWLSLVVEYSGEKPPPLPNLDYKIEVGDSICSPNPTGGLELGFRKNLVEQYQEKKSEYLNVHYAAKLHLRKDVEKLRSDIAGWAQRGVNEFDWAVDFSEVFTSGGFDTVLANPPYVRQELIKEKKPLLQRIYSEIYHGTSDLYCYFYARAIQLLKPTGTLVFISSNKWFHGGYGQKLRKHIGASCSVRSITDFGDLAVFEGATAYPMIFVAHKGRTESSQTLFTEVKSLDPPYPDVRALIRQHGKILPLGSLDGSDWQFNDSEVSQRLTVMKKAGSTLADYVGGRIYYGIKTGLNQAFVIDAETRHRLIGEDPKSAELIKPWVCGRDVRRWHVSSTQQHVIFARRGVDIDAYPAIKRHLGEWKAELTPKKTGKELRGRKPGSYKWYEIQDEVAYFAAFEKPKIVVPGLMLHPTYAIAARGAHVNVPAAIIGSDDIFLLAVLNSATLWSLFESITIKVQQGYLRIYIRELSSLPIPKSTRSDQNAICDLAERCIEAKGIGCGEWEFEINRRVAALYKVEPAMAKGETPRTGRRRVGG